MQTVEFERGTSLLRRILLKQINPNNYITREGERIVPFLFNYFNKIVYSYDREKERKMHFDSKYNPFHLLNILCTRNDRLANYLKLSSPAELLP